MVIDVDTGEVLAMVNQPSFNPNDRDQLQVGLYRNRAATDILEPGSSIKPFVIAAALESGQFHTDSVVDTAPGFLKVGNKVFDDEHPLGECGHCHHPRQVQQCRHAQDRAVAQARADLAHAHRLGLRASDGRRFSGRVGRHVEPLLHWRPIGIATLSHGYGLSVTPLQLAHAYATVGAGGVARPISFERVTGPVAGQQVISRSSADRWCS